MSWPSRRSSKRCTPKLQSRISLKPIKIQARATPGRNGGIRTCRPTRVPRHGIDFAVSRHGHCRKASLPNRGARSDGSLRPPATRLRASCARAMSTDTPLTDEQKANADEAYYRELLQRVDSTIAQTSKVQCPYAPHTESISMSIFAKMACCKHVCPLATRAWPSSPFLQHLDYTNPFDGAYNDLTM